jgi:hypothetical protein
MGIFKSGQALRFLKRLLTPDNTLLDIRRPLFAHGCKMHCSVGEGSEDAQCPMDNLI